jgi:tetratricopeptide (TPR) repeat protein
MFKHRVARNRSLYFGFLFCVLALFGYLITNYHWELYELILMALLFLIPGRLVQYFWRDFFAGRKCLNHENPDEAIPYFEKFLDYVKKSPWVKWLVFFSYGVYSLRVEAMAQTYLGICYIRKKDFARAHALFQMALDIDTKYSIALYHKAIVFALEHDEANARHFLNEAAFNGYPKITFEEFLTLVQEQFTARRSN